MQILKLSEDHKQQYEQFVAANNSGSFLQSWGWGEFQTKLGKSVIHYGIFSDENLNDKKSSSQTLVGSVQFFKTKIPHLPGYYLYAPYGPLLSLDVSSNDFQKIISELVSEIKIDFADCWFIRFEPKDNLQTAGQTTVHIQPGKTLVTDLSKSLEELQSEMHQKTRYNIKVADKHNISIESEISVSPQHGFHIAELVELLTKTSSRQKFKSYDRDYYENLIDFFVLHSPQTDCKVSLYKALYNKKLVAGAIMVDHGSTRTYLFGGSSYDDKNLMAPYALHWQAMQDAKNNGLTKYDWWVIETATGQTPGFVQFKLKWGGQQISYPSAIDIVQKNGWYFIYKILRKLNRWL